MTRLIVFPFTGLTLACKLFPLFNFLLMDYFVRLGDGLSFLYACSYLSILWYLTYKLLKDLFVLFFNFTASRAFDHLQRLLITLVGSALSVACRDVLTAYEVVCLALLAIKGGQFALVYGWIYRQKLDQIGPDFVEYSQ